VVGLGLPPSKIDFVLGVLKAYCTRVGSGPFPTEMEPATAEMIRQRGAEFGATTGRPRRIGWLDLVCARDAARWNGINGWAVTKLDVLESVDSLQICSAYRIEEQILPGVPPTIQGWEEVKPVYEKIAGWIGGKTARRLHELPTGAQDYLKKIESYTGVPVSMISLGAGPDETILPHGDLV
jgi:adenylosuccinate synthase